MGCQHHVRQLAARVPELRDLGAEVVVVGPGQPKDAARLVERLRVPLRILGDPSGAALDSLGFTRVLGLIRKSGSVVVDREGVVRHAHQTANAGDALQLKAIFAALPAVQG